MQLHTDLAIAIANTRIRQDSAAKTIVTKQSEPEDEEGDDLDEEGDDLDEQIAKHEDALYAAVAAVQDRLDAKDDEMDDEYMDPIELAAEMVKTFEEAKLFLAPDTTFASLAKAAEDVSEDGQFDSSDIQALALMNQYPNLDIDYSNSSEIYGAYRLMVHRSTSNFDSEDEETSPIDSSLSDRQLGDQLGIRKDSSGLSNRLIAAPAELTKYY